MHATDRHPTRIAVLATLIALAAGSFTQAQEPPKIVAGTGRLQKVDFSDRVVSFTTADGVVIEADWYPVKVSPNKKTPVAILVHMYPADRKSWLPIVEDLRAAGIAVLAYDIRGTGGSTQPAEKNLAELYKKRDPQLFADAWQDASAAHIWLQAQTHIDFGRYVLIGASVGCSISLQYGTMMSDAKAIVCLSPGVDYMGIPSDQHIKTCADYNIPILLISPEGEYASVEKLIEASGGRAKGQKFDGDKEQHGTKMFDAPYGPKVKRAIVEFVCKGLDIPVPKEKQPDPAADAGKSKSDKSGSGKSKADKPKKKKGDKSRSKKKSSGGKKAPQDKDQ